MRKSNSQDRLGVVKLGVNRAQEYGGKRITHLCYKAVVLGNSVQCAKPVLGRPCGPGCQNEIERIEMVVEAIKVRVCPWCGAAQESPKTVFGDLFLCSECEEVYRQPVISTRYQCGKCEELHARKEDAKVCCLSKCTELGKGRG